MPRNKFALARYQVIDSLLKKNEYVKSRQMQEACYKKTGYQVTRRTIQLDIEAMKTDPFLGYHIPIDYCSQRKAYYYTEHNYSFTSHLLVSEDIRILEKILAECKEQIPKNHRRTIEQIIFKLNLFLK